MFCFGLKYLLAKDQERIKQFLILAAVTLSVSMINPHGFAGLFYPLNIFDGYGYMTAENQSIFFMQKRYPMVLAYYYYELIVLVTLVSSIFTRKKNYFPLVLLASLCLILGLKTNRAMTLGALTAIPLLAYNLSFLTHKLKDFGYKLLFVTLIILSLFIYLYQFQLGKKITSFEFNPQVNQTAVFFKYNNIEGPIFNNFDIGGYLIYHLFPARRVFVDNRPEAYSEEFMQQIYLKALEDEASWQELDQQINFNVIYFYRHDLTEHGQPFLIRRLQDSSWVPVAVDQSNIILLKNNDKNVEIIEKYRLPDSMFRAVKV